MTYLAVAVIVLYLISLPIVFDVSANVDTEKNIGSVCIKLLFIPVFIKKIDVFVLKERILRGDLQEQIESPPSTQKRSRIGAFFFAVAIKTAKAIKVDYAHLYARVGTGDAAADAIIVGTLKIAIEQLCASIGYVGNEFSIVPDYRSEMIRLDFLGIFSISFADIIVAVCRAAQCKISVSGRRSSCANVVK